MGWKRGCGWIAACALFACDDGGQVQLTDPADRGVDGAVDMQVDPPVVDGGQADQGQADGGQVDATPSDMSAPADMDVAPGDMAPADAGPLPGPCGGALESHQVVLPLGETVFLDGDDYLVPFDDGRDCPVSLEAPADAQADIIDQRLTPDRVGQWVLVRGNQRITLDVRADTLNADTFVNYNYTPVNALTAVDADTLVVVSPPSNAVHVVGVGADPKALDLVPTGAWPTSVVMWPDSGMALVAQTGRDSLGFLDLERRQIVDAIRVGDEPAGIVVQGDVAYVTLSGADQVARVDLVTKTVTDRLPVGHDPRAMALSADGSTLYVAALMSYNDHREGPSGPPTTPAFQRDITIIDTARFAEVGVIPEIGTMIRGLHLTADNRLIAGVSHSHNERAAVDAETNPHTHGLAVVDLNAEPPTVTQIDLDRGTPSASPFTLAASPDDSRIVVSLSASKALLVLDSQSLDEVARLPTGNDPRGLAFMGDRLWTTAWLDNQVEGHAWPPAVGAAPVVLAVGADPTPPDVKAGQRIFNDATFSRYGQFSCNNCHIDGLTDGLVWDLLVDGEVNTLAFRNVAGTDPFLWGGQLPTLFDFSREVLRLVGGNATGQQMEQLTVYMQSITAPPNPYTRPGGRLTAAGERGKRLFEAGVADGGAGCADCHAGAQFTNRQVVPGKTEGTQTDVPGLVNVYDTAPYGRKAQWATLEDMLDRGLTYTGAADLDADAKTDLLAYLQQIPGDAMWLNAARPLSGSDHVWVQTPIELTFSHSLAEGQADRFRFLDGAGDPVPGEWQVRGRVARFLPAEVLPNESAFRIEVDAPLRGALGQVMRDPLRMEWTTGGVPELDVSGRFLMTLQTAAFDIRPDPQVEVAALQSAGGNVTGVLYGLADLVELSHVEGVVSGERLVLEPFLFDTEFGQLRVEEAYMDLTDDDGDGFADSGVGTVSLLGVEVPWSGVRLALPPQE